MSETDVTVDPQTAPDPALTKWVPVQGPALPPTAGQASKVLTVTTDGAAPTWAPPTGGSGGGASITYRGDYSAATTYHDGDYVVGPDGVTYQCVKEGTVGVTPAPWSSGLWAYPTPVINGQWIKGVGGSAVWAPITPADVANIPYGTSLPASPYDGQEAILVKSLNSATDPPYHWRFRYNAGSSRTEKWEFIGGTSAYLVAAQGQWVGMTPGWSVYNPAFVAPRSGVYDVEFGGQFQGNLNSLIQFGINPSGGGSPTGSWCAAGGTAYVTHQKGRTGVVAQGGSIQPYLYAGDTSCQFANFYAFFIPVRVS